MGCPWQELLSGLGGVDDGNEVRFWCLLSGKAVLAYDWQGTLSNHSQRNGSSANSSSLCHTERVSSDLTLLQIKTLAPIHSVYLLFSRPVYAADSPCHCLLPNQICHLVTHSGSTEILLINLRFASNSLSKLLLIIQKYVQGR